MSFLNGTDPSLRQTRTPTTQEFTGSGQSSVTLSNDPGSEDNVIITFDGVVQHRSTYSVSGTTLTFSSAVPTGVAKIEATFTTSHAIQTPSANSVTGAKIADDSIDSEHYVDGSIDTAHIAANQIDSTLTKDAFVGDFTEVTAAAGDSILLGDVSDSGNTKRDTIQGILDLAGGGAWNYISSVTASAAASIAFTSNINSTYEVYAFTLHAVFNSTSARNFDITTSTDGGSSYRSSNYVHIRSQVGSNDSTDSIYSTSNSTMRLWTSMPTTEATGVSTTIYMYDPADADRTTQFTWSNYVDTSVSGYVCHVSGSGLCPNEAVNAVKFTCNVGNLTGVIRMYGLATS